jgi:UPF0176 protein
VYLCVADFEFRSLTELPALARRIEEALRQQSVLGTVLLAPEGINLNLAVGPLESWDTRAAEPLLETLRSEGFELSRPRYSKALAAPFRYFEVQIRAEIVALHREDVRPDLKPGQRLSPEQWRDLVSCPPPGLRILDLRNDFEWEHGHFRGAEKIGMESFRHFQDLAKNWNKTDNLLVYCTGGVRCEKAVTLLEEQGFTNLRQLDGGVLRYFEECGAEAWEGDLFVFDDRRTIQPRDVLSESKGVSDGDSESRSG